MNNHAKSNRINKILLIIEFTYLFSVSAMPSCSSAQKSFIASLANDSPDYEESFSSSLEALSQPQERELTFLEL